MTMTKSDAMTSAVTAATQRAVTAWYAFGFFIPLVGILVAYLRNPTLPIAQKADYADQGMLGIYEAQFVETLKARQVRATWIGAIVAVCLYMLLFMAMCALGVAGVASIPTGSGGGISGVIQEAIEEQRMVTADKFARIRDGMTYAQVREIIGADGEEQSRTTFGGITTVMYAWTNSAFSAMNAMFQNDALVSKTQFGL